MMNILIAGSSGFIGSALRTYLSAQGHTVCRLVRRTEGLAPDEISWNPAKEFIPIERLSEFQAVVNLCGENLMGIWTQAQKQRIYSSRVDTAAFLASAIAASNPMPRVFVCASAIGFYGSRADQELTEKSLAGEGFLAKVCQDWEAAAMSQSISGSRVVCLRLGVVLDKQGGALARMIPPFKMGLGGPLASGLQWQSWISLADVVRAVEFAINTDSLEGPVNAVSPQPVRNVELTQWLADSLRRPAIFRIPAFGLRMLPGGFADEVLLSSVRAIPEKLLAAGFTFQYPHLREFLRSHLGSE